jgi:hypothetical protein
VELEEQAVVPVTGRAPRSVLCFSVALFSVAVTVWIALVAGGAPRPSAAAVLMLAVVVALCVNRFALFPSEHAATAEAAVLLAAVVGFHSDAAFLGPLTVALLVGPLDTLHWSQRSFLRMAYNAGNRGVSTLAAATGYSVVERLLGGSVAASTVAVVLAVVGFAAVDLVVSFTLLRFHGARAPAAVREVLAVDVLTVPVAVSGALVGCLAPIVGWWAVALLLVPVAFVPELALGRRSWRPAIVRDVVVLGLVAGVLVGLVLVAPVPALSTLLVLVALALLTGSRLTAQGRVVPPMLAVLVMTAVVVTHGDATFLAATLTALAGTLSASRSRRPPARAPLSCSLLVALIGAAGAATVSLAAPASLAAATVAALVAGFGFEVVTVVSSARPRRPAQIVWTAPVLIGAAAWAFLWRAIGTGGALPYVAGLVVMFVMVAWWGACPWRLPAGLRALGRSAGRRLAPILAVTCCLALAFVGAAVLANDAGLRAVLGWTGVAVAETAVAMALTGVCQWRFAPRPRLVALVALVGVALAVALSVPSLVAGQEVVVVPATAVALLVVVAGGANPAARAREVAEPRAGRVGVR